MTAAELIAELSRYAPGTPVRADIPLTKKMIDGADHTGFASVITVRFCGSFLKIEADSKWE